MACANAERAHINPSLCGMSECGSSTKLKDTLTHSNDFSYTQAHTHIAKETRKKAEF